MTPPESQVHFVTALRTTHTTMPGERPPFSPSRPFSKSTASLRPIALSPTLPLERGVLSTPFAGTSPLGSSPARRTDATSLGQWMERELVKLRADEARKGTSETHVLKAARAIYSVAFREVTRQVTITCAERGALLSKIFAVHSDLLDGMLAERERWKLAEAAAWVTQQQAADATKLRAKVARMLLSTQQVLASQQDDGLRSGADDSKNGGRLAAGSGIGGMGDLFAATDMLRPQEGGLSSPAEGSGQGDEQARLARTLELAAGLGGKSAETLLRTLMSDDAGALPSVGTEARLLAADSLVSSLDTARRVTWLSAHAQRLPPPDEHQLLVALLRNMGVSRWASLLAEVRGSPTRRAAPHPGHPRPPSPRQLTPAPNSRAKLVSPLGPPTEAARFTRGALPSLRLYAPHLPCISRRCLHGRRCWWSSLCSSSLPSSRPRSSS